MEKLIPEIVSGEEGHMGISYGQLTAVLVNAIKEQQVLIERQQMQIDEMKALMIASKILRAGE